MMTPTDFNLLTEYSTTVPSGVYPGKCWKARYGESWYLRWYDVDDDDPLGIPTLSRKIVVITSL